MNDSPRRRARRGQPILAEDIARLQDAAWQGRPMQQARHTADPTVLLPTYAHVLADSAIGEIDVFDYLTSIGEEGEFSPGAFLHVRVVETGELLNVFKPMTLRSNLLSRAGVTFEYSTPQARTATQGAVVENQVIVPSYEVGDIIVIERTYYLSGFTVWRDVNDDGRQWAVTTE